MTAKAFVPGHVTGFFRIFDEYEDPLRCGSRGAGFSVVIGTETTVSTMDHSSLEIITDYNNERIDAKVTETVVRRLTEDYEQTLKVHVSHVSSLPSEAGFGSSGAGALGTAYALGHLLDNEISPVKAARYAHYAEVVNHTGLGDVISQTVGGMEVRKEPGSPGVGVTLGIPHSKSVKVVLAGASGLKTSEVLTDPVSRKCINEAGDELVSRIVDNLTIQTFIQCSREFSERIGLKTGRVEVALNELESAGFVDSSMVMLGDSVFCFCSDNETSDVKDILTRHWNANEVFVTDISERGGRLL
jgi:pantoate kinase